MMLDRIRAKWWKKRRDPVTHPVAEKRAQLAAAIEAGRKSCRDSATAARDFENESTRLEKKEREAAERGEIKLAEALREERESMEGALALIRIQHEQMARFVEEAELKAHRILGEPDDPGVR